jgi:integrase
MNEAHQPDDGRQSERKSLAKRTMVFNDLVITRLDARKELEAINLVRRQNGQKEVNQFLVWDQEQLNGLVLLVGTRTKTFRVQVKLHGKWKFHTIGRFGALVPPDDLHLGQVGEARRLAVRYRDLAKKGIDPDKQQQGQQPQPQPSLTYGKVVDLFIEQHAKKQQRTWDQTERVLKKTCPAWLDRPIASIAPDEVRALVRSFDTEGHPYKAVITKQWLSLLWRWAYDEDHVTVPIIKGLRGVKISKPKRKRTVYTSDEIVAIWRAADKLDDKHEGAFVKLLLLLAPRKSALALLRPSHLDNRNDPTLWTTPFELTKSRKTMEEREYKTPLPPLAVSILKEVLKQHGGGNALVFPMLKIVTTPSNQQRHDGGPLAMRLVKHGAPADFNFHAARHTLATWLQGKSHSEWEVGAILNHSAGSSVTAGYQHGDQRKLKLKLLTKWAKHIEGLVGLQPPTASKPRTNVIPIDSLRAPAD